MIKKILVPTDGSNHAIKAVEFASDTALKYKATVYIVHVIEPILRGRMATHTEDFQKILKTNGEGSLA